MDLTFTPEVEAFREEARAFVRDNLTRDIRRKVAAEHIGKLFVVLHEIVGHMG